MYLDFFIITFRYISAMINKSDPQLIGADSQQLGLKKHRQARTQTHKNPQPANTIWNIQAVFKQHMASHNLLKGSETMQVIRNRIKNDGLDIKTTGKGRTKKVIVAEVNRALRSRNNKKKLARRKSTRSLRVQSMDLCSDSVDFPTSISMIDNGGTFAGSSFITISKR